MVFLESFPCGGGEDVARFYGGETNRRNWKTRDETSSIGELTLPQWELKGEWFGDNNAKNRSL